ncbi:FAD:protein FMN transferase [Dyadobacter chenwenxiniae]|uniref:FAD:protein FMN transferase n=1 Tax=Dyadobacter chenwenxiniae TaxID=2906456 RepID=A0A9X1TEV3_9BACT|nr:FAD:protein FMN transferase [Dyadobacter chenwenxiniae]MCF0063596.1 FAD:protein FMN transferase [Dyadobacter chenwenxiniae]UON83272.1 FAD:protein FMN transferase [Dyadobacter chenwenxiniae]
MFSERIVKCVFIWGLSAVTSFTYAQESRYSFEQGMMGSPFKLVFYAKNDSVANIAAQSAFKRIEKLNELLSDYRDGSEINMLSAQSGSGKWVPVSDDLFNILAISQDISVKTDGAFDATLGPVVQMWRHATRKGIFPKESEIKEAMAKTGYTKMKLDPKSKKVFLSQKGMRLDIGGLGKGFAAEEAVKVLQTFGIKSIMMDAGGKIVLTSPPPGTEGWNITISNGSDSLKTMALSNVALATSGPTYRFMEYNGTRYSHIVDPKTGIGLLFHVRTTVISLDGTVADALATAFSVAGIAKSKKIIARFPDSKVWLVERQDERVAEWNTLE